MVTESVAQIAESVRGGKATATSHVATALAAAEESQDRLNAFTTIDADLALARAGELDRRIASGEPPGSLAGVPVGLKDLIDQVGRITTCGSDFYRHQPERSATVVERLEAEGAVIIGRTGLHEFAYGFSSENDWFGPVHNPYDTTLSPGGSSGGSAAAVGAGVVPVGIGTDTGGSVRVPAALCGSVGLKVTHGRVSLCGVFPLVASIDTVGPITRTAGDARLVYEAMRGGDVEDPWSVDPEDADGDPIDIEDLVIGVPGEWIDRAPLSDVTRHQFEQHLDDLRSLGADVRWESMPDLVPDPLLVTLASAEAAGVHRRWFPQLDKRYGPEVEERLAAAMDVTLDEYLEARRWQASVVGATRRAFSQHDLIATPAVGHNRKTLGEDQIEIDGTEVFYRPVLSAFSALVNQTWCPAVTVPLAQDGTPPPSVQFIAPWWQEATLLDLAEGLERAGLVGHRAPA